ncbi:hypothetical protein VTI28DRAFT_1631 [Corynascus sepedonium]
MQGRNGNVSEDSGQTHSWTSAWAQYVGRHILPKCQRRFRKPESQEFGDVTIDGKRQSSGRKREHRLQWVLHRVRQIPACGAKESAESSELWYGRATNELIAVQKVIWIPTSLVLHSLRPSARCHTDQGGLEFGSG